MLSRLETIIWMAGGIACIITGIGALSLVLPDSIRIGVIFGIGFAIAMTIAMGGSRANTESSAHQTDDAEVVDELGWAA